MPRSCSYAIHKEMARLTKNSQHVCALYFVQNPAAQNTLLHVRVQFLESYP